MKNLAVLRDELRPHGANAPGCPKCVHFRECGGFEPSASLFNTDCFRANCCKFAVSREKPCDCDNVCPHNERYLDYLAEVGGLTFASLTPLSQKVVELPRYVPLVHHRYCHRKPLSWPVVALDTYQVVKLRGGRMEAIAENPDGLREQFGLAPSTKVILRGVADDRPLERYWSYRRRDNVPAQLARLATILAVGPNFSHFLDVPRTDNLFNRKRQLICLGEFTNAGLNPVPHLNAAQPSDWRFWQRFLAENATISHVAVEFETGNRSPKEGKKVIGHLSAIQRFLGRPLWPIVIGGTQYLESFAEHFRDASFIDSTPFVKATRRRKFLRLGSRPQWEEGFTLVGQGVDAILTENLGRYTDSVVQRWDASKRGTGAPVPIPSQN